LCFPTGSLRSSSTIDQDQSLPVAEHEPPSAGAASNFDSTSYVQSTSQADKAGKGGGGNEGDTEDEDDRDGTRMKRRTTKRRVTK
jgi:hypothetical protein